MNRIGSDQQEGKWIPDQLTYKDIEYWEWIVRLGINPADMFVPNGQRPCWGAPCYLGDVVQDIESLTPSCKYCPYNESCKDIGHVKD